MRGRSFLMLGLVIGLSGCVGFSKSPTSDDWACRAVNGTGCTSVSEIDGEALTVRPDPFRSRFQQRESGSDVLRANASGPVEALVYVEILPWTDANGVRHPGKRGWQTSSGAEVLALAALEDEEH